VAEEDRGETELKMNAHCEEKERETGDDAGKNERKKDQAAKECFAGEAGAIKSECGEKAERQGKCDGTGCDEEAVEDGIPDGRVGEELAVPIEREMARRETAYTLAVEGVDDQNSDG
jgi:hypothetical protein